MAKKRGKLNGQSEKMNGAAREQEETRPEDIEGIAPDINIEDQMEDDAEDDDDDDDFERSQMSSSPSIPDEVRILKTVVPLTRSRRLTLSLYTLCIHLLQQ